MRRPPPRRTGIAAAASGRFSALRPSGSSLSFALRPSGSSLSFALRPSGSSLSPGELQRLPDQVADGLGLDQETVVAVARVDDRQAGAAGQQFGQLLLQA